MDIEEALALVSYKLAIKSKEQALNDKVLDQDQVQQAILDQQRGEVKKIDLKQYMAATKLVKEHRTQLFKEENEQFLANNSSKDGVITQPSGLQYKILKAGQSPTNTPALEQSVSVHYHGTLIDGTVFDSSVDRGKPASFSISKVIKGWQEGLQLMSAGASYQFFIPQDLAYGDRGNGSAVPPFATLIFEVELLEII